MRRLFKALGQPAKSEKDEGGNKSTFKKTFYDFDTQLLYLAICRLSIWSEQSKVVFQIFLKIKWICERETTKTVWIPSKSDASFHTHTKWDCVYTSWNGMSVDRNRGASLSSNDKCSFRVDGSRTVLELNKTSTILKCEKGVPILVYFELLFSNNAGMKN